MKILKISIVKGEEWAHNLYFRHYVLFIWMSHQLRCENYNQHIQTLVLYEIGNFLTVQWPFSESI